MLSSTRSTGGEEAGRLRGLARLALMSGWVVFWLNTALFPCCEVAAAVLGGHADNGSRSASAAAPPHYSGATHSEPLGQRPDSPCAYSLSAEPALGGDYEVLTSDRSPQEWFAVDLAVATSRTLVNYSANLAHARASAQPSLRLYLRTQRLLL